MVGYCSKEVGVSIKVVGEGITPQTQNAKHVTHLVRPMKTLCNVQNTPTHYDAAVKIGSSSLFLSFDFTAISN